ncbi:MAG: hypothetical protein WD847_07575 [Pirellulales bacterium]
MNTTRTLLLLILGLVVLPEAARAQQTPAPAFSPDGSILAAAAEDATVALWEVATGKKLASLYRPKESDFLRGSALVWTPTMLFSPDGKILATQRGDEPAMLWRVADGKQMASLSDGGVIGHLEFSPGGKLLMALGHDDKASGRNRLTLWEVTTGKERAAFREAEHVEFLEAAFSPDGKTYMAVVGSREPDNTRIRIWDTQQHKELARFQGAGARFAPGGKVLAVWDRDGKISLWDTGTGKQQALGSAADRRIGKEPLYQANPRYCLLLFGREVTTSVWLVLDGDQLYADRNGNGDLTDDGEPVRATKSSRLASDKAPRRFKIGEIRDGNRTHGNLLFQVTSLSGFATEDQAKELLARDPDALAYRLWADVEVPGFKGQGVEGRLEQYVQYSDVNGFLQFADRPQDAPIIHFGGELQIMLWARPALTLGRPTDVYLALGTPGFGAGTTAYVGYEGVVPEDRWPTVEVVYPPGMAGEPPVRETYELPRRC